MNKNQNPIEILTHWLAEEKGAPDPEHIILSTATDMVVHSRVVAI